MKHVCLFKSGVVDKRVTKTKGYIRRRRVCKVCKAHFSTIEIVRILKAGY